MANNILENLMNSFGTTSEDDPKFIHFLKNQSCFYLLSLIPSQQEVCKTRVEMNNILLSKRFYYCRNFLSELRSIPYAIIKGAVLSKQIYNNTGYRFSGDIDLLVSQNHVDDVKRILFDNGFIQGKVVDDEIVPYSRTELIYQKSFTHQIASFVKKTDSLICPFVNVDVNADIFWGESNKKVDMDSILSDIVDVDLFNVTIKKLSVEKEFISLCLHHYKDMNSIYLLSQRGLSLSQFCDIYFYIENQNLNYKNLKDICVQLGCLEYVFFCVHHTSQLFKCGKCIELSHFLRTDDGESFLSRFGLSEDERHIWDKPITVYLFKDNIREYVSSKLSEKEKTKVAINIRMM